MWVIPDREQEPLSTAPVAKTLCLLPSPPGKPRKQEVLLQMHFKKIKPLVSTTLWLNFKANVTASSTILAQMGEKTQHGNESNIVPVFSSKAHNQPSEHPGFQHKSSLTSLHTLIQPPPQKITMCHQEVLAYKG